MAASAILKGVTTDALVCTAIFVHWLFVGMIVDQTGNSVDARKIASLWIAMVTLGSNVITIGRSYVFLGENKAKERPETIFGLFFEIVSLAQGWGALFCYVRVWGLDADHPFQTRDFLHNIGNSVFEMSLVQAGVGWAAEAPVTVWERIAAWCAAYIGGVLCVNLFFLSLVFGRRGWWNFRPDHSESDIQTSGALINQGMERVGKWHLHSLGER